ncbi:MAG: hypothetical protein IH845_01465 [Nanoarchaeota archaeon]|nr:hypothetical protein [Nanoarchaeota archaeon]
MTTKSGYDLHGTYNALPESKRVNPNTTELIINGQKACIYYPKSGILRMSINKKELEYLVDSFGMIPNGGIDLKFHNPLGYGPVIFKGVKKIKQIPAIGGYFLLTNNSMPKKSGKLIIS